MKNISFYKIEVEPDKEKRIDQLISNQLPEYSRSRIKNWIKNENITLNGKKCSPKDKISVKSIVEIKISETEELDIKPQNIDINIIHKDDDLLIVDKRPNMVTHIAPGHYMGTLQNALLFHYPDLKNVPRAGIIHRLDKGTSGLIIIARNLISHNALIDQMRNKLITKKYIALVTGEIIKNQTINKKIGRNRINRLKMSISPSGKDSITKVKVLEKLYKSSFLDIELITGRTHQIRVHLSHIGHPIIGDKLYGFKCNIFNHNKNLLNFLNTYDAHALHAKNLSFNHPKTKKKLIINSETPETFVTIKALLSE
ncbi:MAG: RluA family pseudouridine synthase [Pseudomonadota bacterium]|nr:RluA family pseudouridine synthase [Pseudomonadota bacterium]